MSVKEREVHSRPTAPKLLHEGRGWGVRAAGGICATRNYGQLHGVVLRVHHGVVVRLAPPPPAECSSRCCIRGARGRVCVLANLPFGAILCKALFLSALCGGRLCLWIDVRITFEAFIFRSAGIIFPRRAGWVLGHGPPPPQLRGCAGMVVCGSRKASWPPVILSQRDVGVDLLQTGLGSGFVDQAEDRILHLSTLQHEPDSPYGRIGKVRLRPEHHILVRADVRERRYTGGAWRGELAGDLLCRLRWRRHDEDSCQGQRSHER